MKKIMFIFIGILLVGGVIAVGIGINGLDETRELSKAERDILLTKTSDGKIQPNISIKCSDDYCLYNIYQQGIIDSRNNRINKFYLNCINYDINESECLETEKLYYTNEIIEDIIANETLDKLSKYANAELTRENYEDWGTGTIIISEKK